MIEVTGGVDIEKFSIYQGATGEAEVLLFPGANLKVVSTAQLGNGLTQVHLKMLKTPMEADAVSITRAHGAARMYRCTFAASRVVRGWLRMCLAGGAY